MVMVKQLSSLVNKVVSEMDEHIENCPLCFGINVRFLYQTLIPSCPIEDVDKEKLPIPNVELPIIWMLVTFSGTQLTVAIILVVS